MYNELIQPSLKNNDKVELKTYDISKIFLVAFFGGVIPTIALGTKNAKWLRIDKKNIVAMIVFGVLVLLSKFVVTMLLLTDNIEVNESTIRLFYKVGSMLVYLGYYLMMKNKIKQHNITVGEFEPIGKDAFKWIVIGIIIEIILFVGGGYVITNVL